MCYIFYYAKKKKEKKFLQGKFRIALIDQGELQFSLTELTLDIYILPTQDKDSTPSHFKTMLESSPQINF